MAGKGQPGRADGLTDEIAKRILDAVRAGATIKDAAEHAGITDRTVYRWLERADQPGTKNAKFGRFGRDLTRARADAKVGAIAAIRRAMPGDWRAAVAYLERRYPEEWSQRSRHEVTGPAGGPIRSEATVDLRQLAGDDLELLERLLSKASSNGHGTISS